MKDEELSFEKLVKAAKMLDDNCRRYVPLEEWSSITCPECGLEIKGIMMYSCPRVDCPSGLGPVLL